MDCFVAAIVKGLVEHNDARRHFGSLLDFSSHMEKARKLGVVVGEGEDVSVTEKGREWYEQKKLCDLPQGRAYMWTLVREDDWAMTPNR